MARRMYLMAWEIARLSLLRSPATTPTSREFEPVMVPSMEKLRAV